MSDALWDSTKSDLEEIAHIEYLKSIIQFIDNPSEQTKNNCLQLIETFAEKFHARFSRNGLRNDLQLLSCNDHRAWKGLNDALERSLFNEFPDYKAMFKSAAQKRGIGRWEWII